MIVVEGLILFVADGIEQFDQLPGENLGGVFDEEFLGFFAGGIAGIGVLDLADNFEGFGFNGVGVDGVE